MNGTKEVYFLTKLEMFGAGETATQATVVKTVTGDVNEAANWMKKGVEYDYDSHWVDSFSFMLKMLPLGKVWDGLKFEVRHELLQKAGLGQLSAFHSWVNFTEGVQQQLGATLATWLMEEGK